MKRKRKYAFLDILSNKQPVFGQKSGKSLISCDFEQEDQGNAQLLEPGQDVYRARAAMVLYNGLTQGIFK